MKNTLKKTFNRILMWICRDNIATEVASSIMDGAPIQALKSVESIGESKDQINVLFAADDSEFTSYEVARKYGVNVRKVRTWRLSGKLKFRKVSRRTIVYRLSDVNEFLRSNGSDLKMIKRGVRQPYIGIGSMWTTREVANEFGVANQTVRNWIKMGVIPSLLVSKRCRVYDINEVRKALGNKRPFTKYILRNKF